MIAKKNWYVIYTRPGYENKIVKTLARKNIEHYLPAVKVVQKTIVRNKTYTEPLFTSCVFVKISGDQKVKLVKFKGVINLLYWLNQPLIIPAGEIETIKHFLNDHPNVSVEKIVNAHFQKNQAGRTLLIGPPKTLQAVKRSNIKTLLPTLGYLLCA
jgi:transcription antitermination factor NusG